jgi:hypothetical protein
LLISGAQRVYPFGVCITFEGIEEYCSELKGWIIDAIVQPINLSESLWQAQTATEGEIGQSGAVSEQRAEQLVEESIPVMDHVVESLLLFRAHHCMADGVSLGAMFGTFMDKGLEFEALVAQKVK